MGLARSYRDFSLEYAAPNPGGEEEEEEGQQHPQHQQPSPVSSGVDFQHGIFAQALSAQANPYLQQPLPHHPSVHPAGAQLTPSPQSSSAAASTSHAETYQSQYFPQLHQRPQFGPLRPSPTHHYAGGSQRQQPSSQAQIYSTQISRHPSSRKRDRPEDLGPLDIQGLQAGVLDAPPSREEPSSATALRFTPTQQHRPSQSLDLPVELTHQALQQPVQRQALPIQYQQQQHTLTAGPAQHQQQQALQSQTQFQPTQTQAAAAQQHHHHRLPNQPPPAKMQRQYGDPSSISPTSPTLTQHFHGPPSVVGQEGMPPPAARPRGPKLKFTPEDDQLLVDLKEKKNLTWKQIADFFPGRSSGTLQVRYCTKLKAKTTVWTDDMVSLQI
ncbi:MAG: hypothetical protein M1822_006682 [Bathelium mastoideum]|nr:MAG: hypothetical protein M1822_006682 [Bathelium mastoideum]